MTIERYQIGENIVNHINYCWDIISIGDKVKRLRMLTVDKVSGSEGIIIS